MRGVTERAAVECGPRISASTSALLCSPKGSWLCCMFGILSSSFILTPTFDKHGTTPFAAGGFSEVYEATLGRRRVAVKVLTTNRKTIKVVHQVSGLFPPHRRGHLCLAISSLSKRLSGGSGSVTRTSCHLLVFG